jgi:hypothetical protein
LRLLDQDGKLVSTNVRGELGGGGQATAEAVILLRHPCFAKRSAGQRGFGPARPVIITSVSSVNSCGYSGFELQRLLKR